MRAMRGPIGRDSLISRGKGIEQPSKKVKRKKEENCLKVWTTSKKRRKFKQLYGNLLRNPKTTDDYDESVYWGYDPVYE